MDGIKGGVATETDLDGTNGRSVFVTFERKAEKCTGTLIPFRETTEGTVTAER